MPEAAPARPERGRTLGADLRAQLEREIVEGELARGQKLDEAILAERFGVSRTPVREALRALAATGLVEIRPRFGAVVARPTAAETMDLFELVAELEGRLAETQAQVESLTAANETLTDDLARTEKTMVARMDETAAEEIRAAHEACRAAAQGGDAAGYWSVNGRFHAAIRDAAGNSALRRQIEEMDKRLSPYRRFITFRPGRTRTALKEHEEIAEAVAARDGERAGRAMRDHVRVLADDVFALVKSLSL